jgi:hypothetical protein
MDQKSMTRRSETDDCREPAESEEKEKEKEKEKDG